MGLGYWRHGAVALLAVLTLSVGGGGTVLAADLQVNDVVFDGVVAVHWADIDHGAMAGAVVRILWYHHVDDIHGIVPLGDPIDADGNVVIHGVPRPAAGADPVFLDIFGDLDIAAIDAEGCTRFESWSAQERAVPAGSSLDVKLATSARSLSVNCPNATSRPTPEVVGFVPLAGGVAGVTGRPQITPPATDMTVDATPVESPLVFALLALLGVTTIVVLGVSLVFARRDWRDR